MSLVEIRIAKLLGPSCFFLYSLLKSKRGLSVDNLGVEANMSPNSIRDRLKDLVKHNIITRKKGALSDPRIYTYSINFEDNWRI